MQERKDYVKFKGNYVTLVGNEVKPGDKASDFSVIKNDMTEFRLSSAKGKVVVISAFPSIDTPVCNLQAARFNSEAGKYLNDVVIVTVSVDLPFALSRYCAAEGVKNAITTSDYKDLDFGYKYGFVIKELRLLERGVVVIDRDGIIRYVEYCKDVSSHPDYDKAMDVVKTLI